MSTQTLPLPTTTIQPVPALAGNPKARLISRIHTSEAGAQAMEYGALAAGGCGVVGFIMTVLSSDGIKTAIINLLSGVIGGLGTFVTGLFT